MNISAWFEHALQSQGNFRAFMNFLFFPLSWRDLRVGMVGLSLALVLPCAQAERADRFKSLEVESDQPGKMDLPKKLVVFNGNVSISKGTLLIRAGRIEVQEIQGQHHAVAWGTGAGVATFRQKREGVDEFIEGQAQRLEYDAKLNTVRFVNQAQIRRMRGTQVVDQAHGALIVYDNAAEVFTVSGGAGAVTPANPKGRVKVVLSPASRESSPTSPPPPASQP
jgi:lipopolysaccharide export system protein LptA